MSNFGKFALELEDLAAQAKLSAQQMLAAATALEKYEASIHAARSASLEDRQKIDAYLETLDGEVNSDMPTSEILSSAGVLKKQGTSQYARHAMQKLIAHYTK
jgi:hypothetical protein